MGKRAEDEVGVEAASKFTGNLATVNQSENERWNAMHEAKNHSVECVAFQAIYAGSGWLWGAGPQVKVVGPITQERSQRPGRRQMRQNANEDSSGI